MLRDKSKMVTYTFTTLYVLLGIYLINIGALIAADTDGYMLGSSVTRSPLLPIWLGTYLYMTGDEEFYYMAIMHIVLGFTAIYLLSKQICQFFKANQWIQYVLALVLLIPYLSPLKIGNYILTEAITYPLYLWVSWYLVKAVLTRRAKYFVVASLGLMLLVLTRGQFLFLYPVFVLCLGYLLWKDDQKKRWGIMLLVFFVTIICAQLSQRLYHKVYFGQFKSVPYTWYQFVNAPLYVSLTPDKDIWNDTFIAEIVDETMHHMHQQGLHFQSPTEEPAVDPYTRYYFGYNTICHRIYGTVLSEHSVTNWYDIERISKEISLTLISQNITSYIPFITKNYIKGFGGYLPFLFISVLGGMVIIQILRHKESNLSLFLAVSICAHMTNMALVVLVEPTLSRYTFYTDFMFVSALILVFYHALFTKKALLCAE